MASYHYLLLIPVVVSIAFWLATVSCVRRFYRAGPSGSAVAEEHSSMRPFISLVKPVCGLEKNLHAHLISACRQDYRPYEVIFAIQNETDPAVEVIRRVQKDRPPEHFRVVIDGTRLGENGKISNLGNGISRAEGDVIVVSDSDMHLRADYLHRIVAPFSDPDVGIVCTLYRARNPDTLFEALEMLTYNADFVPAMILAYVTGASVVCPGASMAIRRSALDAIGGLTPLRNHFVEDYELGRRVSAEGYRVLLIPYDTEMDVEVRTWAEWWRHQVAWDQKIRTVKSWQFISALLLRGIPFSLLYAAAGGPLGGAVIAITVAARVLSAYANARQLGDRDGLRHICLLPLRDLLSILVWSVSLFKQRIQWRGRKFLLKKGRLVVEP